MKLFLLVLVIPFGLLIVVSLLGVRGMRGLFRPWRSPSGVEMPPVARPPTRRDRQTLGLAIAVGAVVGGVVLYAFARSVIGIGSGGSAVVGATTFLVIPAVFGGLYLYLTGGRDRTDK